VLLVLAGLLAGTGLVLRKGSAERSPTDTLWTDRRALPVSDLGTLAPDWVRVARTLRPAVVHIDTWSTKEGGRQSLGMGTGFIVNPAGYIVTNAHVIAGADEVRARLFDGREMSATVLGRDEKVDLALIRVEAGALSVMPLGDSGRLEVGEPILVIGSPFGLDQTATAGIVSALDRKIELKPHDVMIQVDANINPGNSGGPVINRRGQAVGIAAVTFTYEGGHTGIGFAIPTRFAEPVLSRLAAAAGARP
jgi:serine protease Do